MKTPQEVIAEAFEQRPSWGRAIVSERNRVADIASQALNEACYVIVPVNHVKELCGDVEAYVNAQYAGDHPVSVKKRENDLEYVREVRAMIKE